MYNSCEKNKMLLKIQYEYIKRNLNYCDSPFYQLFNIESDKDMSKLEFALNTLNKYYDDLINLISHYQILYFFKAKKYNLNKVLGELINIIYDYINEFNKSQNFKKYNVGHVLEYHILINYDGKDLNNLYDTLDDLRCELLER